MISALVLSLWVLDNQIFVLSYCRNARFQECENHRMQETVRLLGRVNDIVGVGQRFSRIKKSSNSAESKRKSLQAIGIFHNSFGPKKKKKQRN